MLSLRQVNESSTACECTKLVAILTERLLMHVVSMYCEHCDALLVCTCANPTYSLRQINQSGIFKVA